MNLLFVEAGPNGPIRIGRLMSDDPTSKLEELQWGCPATLNILLIAKNPIYSEHELHKIFQKYSMSPKWYRRNTELVKLIENLKINPQYYKSGLQFRKERGYHTTVIWTEDKIEKLRKEYSAKSWNNLCRDFGLSKEQIQKKASQLGIRRKIRRNKRRLRKRPKPRFGS